MNNISIRIKVLVPITILSLVIILSCGFSMVNQKNLLKTSYAISEDCSKSIELLLDMKAKIEAIGKNMYAHCKAATTTTKAVYEETIKEQITDMQEILAQYKKQNGSLFNTRVNNNKKLRGFHELPLIFFNIIP